MDKEIQKENKKRLHIKEGNWAKKIGKVKVKIKKLARLDESSESNESRCSSQEDDNESHAIPLGQMDSVLSITDLKPGDYILVKFESKNKKRVHTSMLKLLKN